MAKDRKPRVQTVNPTVRARIKKESTSLHLSENAYLDLITQLAEAIRTTSMPDGVKDPQILQAVVKNPFLLQMIATLAGTIWSNVKTYFDTDLSDEISLPSSPSPAAPPRPDPPTVQPRPLPQIVMIDPMTGRRIVMPAPGSRSPL